MGAEPQVGERVADESACKPGSVLPRRGVAAIHLGASLPTSSSDLPADSGEQPSGVRCLVLLRVGFT